MKNKLILICLPILFNIPLTASAADCTQAQALKKMQALSIQSSRERQSYVRHPDPHKDAEIRKRHAGMASDIAMVGKVLAEKDYNKACSRYDAIAKKYNVNINSLEKEVAPPPSAAQRAKGACTTADAGTMNAELMQKIQDRMARGEISQNSFREYAQSVGSFSDLFTTNPTEACNRLNALKKKYLG